jgi:CheY-like chemotaxis protein
MPEKTDQDAPIAVEAHPGAHVGHLMDTMEPVRLLFIENAPDHYELAISGFGKLDFQVTVAASGGEALALIQDRPDSFSLALVDTGVADPGWAELCLALAAAAPRLPLILCHSPQDRIDADLAGSMGIREFVRKPPSLRFLLQTVQSVLEYSRIEKLP